MYPEIRQTAQRCGRRPDCWVALAATLLIVLLHLCIPPYVGGLWRDEVNTVNLATQPTWSDLWLHHNQDSFPLLFASTIRVWSGIFGSGDDGLRVVGVLIGLGVVGALWINARWMGLRFPFWPLVLVGANPMVIRYGDSLRAYGLGLLLMFLMFGAMWKVVQSSQRRWLILASVCAVLAVHALYYNAVLLFGLGAGACAAAYVQGSWRPAARALAVGAIAALSMLPYLPMFLHANDWNFLVQYPFTLPWMWQRLCELTGSPHWIGIYLWPALTGAALVAALITFRKPHSSPGDSLRTQRAVFGAVSLLVGLIAYAGFLKLLNYYTQVWYYIALIGFAAACIDPILEPGTSRFHASARAALAIGFLGLTAFPCARIIGYRHTNIDLAAQALKTLARPNDLILVTRWECGVTADRYLKGAVPWYTIPPLSDLRFQAYQPIMAQMRAEAPLAPILAQAEATLRAGHRVWLLGDLQVPPKGQLVPKLARVREDGKGWRGSPAFYMVWVMEVTAFLQEHATRSASIPVKVDQPSINFETLPLRVVEGWR